jgi:hypothetical protein
MAASIQRKICWQITNRFTHCLDDFFKAAVAVRLERDATERLDFTQDHRDTPTW